MGKTTKLKVFSRFKGKVFECLTQYSSRIYNVWFKPMLQKMVKNIELSSILSFHIVCYKTKSLPVKLFYCKHSISFYLRLIFPNNNHHHHNNNNDNNNNNNNKVNSNRNLMN